MVENLVGGVWKLVGAIPNFRDVLQSAAEAHPEIPYKKGMLFRSALTSVASEADVEYLIQELKLKTVIDLRSAAEYTRDPGDRLLFQHFVHKGRPPMPKRLVTANAARITSLCGALAVILAYCGACLWSSVFCSIPVYSALFGAFAISAFVSNLFYRWQHRLLPSDPGATVAYWQSMYIIVAIFHVNDMMSLVISFHSSSFLNFYCDIILVYYRMLLDLFKKN